MQNLKLGIFLFINSVIGYGQVINTGSPKSWNLSIQEKKNIVSPIIMPKVNAQKLLIEDQKTLLDKSKPLRFGHEINVNLGLKNSGKWISLSTGDRIWRLNIVSKKAKSLNFVFDTYKLPEGATVHIYNNDKSSVLGAYTSKLNRKDKKMGTWPIGGESVWIEYYEPVTVKGNGQLNISKVIHGYRALPSLNKNSKIRKKEIESCSYSVNCDVGEEFNELKDKLKHAVALIVIGNSFCTGTLINTTAKDKAPIFLTANHCVNKDGGTEATWAFRFNYISAKTNCGFEDTENVSQVFQTTSGATVLAKNSKSDFKLLRLDGGLGVDWDLEWAGWDRTGLIPRFTVGIHHPDGNFMEVCKDDDVPEKGSVEFENPETNIWKISEKGKGWEIGVTQGGSSGSPLLDPSGRIIGQLTGGLANCRGGINNNSEDWYGRFDVSWSFGKTNGSRLSNWLDPMQTGQVRLNMLSEELNNPIPEKKLVVFPNPAIGKFIIANIDNSETNYFLYNSLGVLVKQGAVLSINQQIFTTALASGVYFLELKKNDTVIQQEKILIRN